MSRKKHKSAHPATHRPAATVAAAQPSPGAAFVLLGGLALLTSAGMSLMLALTSLAAGFKLPGCGAGSDCARAAASAWGKLPGVQWPVSYLGLAFFLAMLAVWLRSGGNFAGPVRGMVWAGGFTSAVFVGVMFSSGYVCNYCLVAHLANFAFLAVAELSRRPGATLPTGQSLATLLGVFIMATGGLAIADVQARRAADAAAARQQDETIQKITQAATRPAIATQPAPVAATREAAAPAATQPSSSTVAADDSPARRPFTGRYRRGPEKAPLRIVMITDYQCPDCLMAEGVIDPLSRSRSDISLSIKHFPFNTPCNPTAPDLHKNACWAARAAEAAGILGGDEGFFRMHRWLFEHKGSFTDQDFPPALSSLGFDPVEFQRVMQTGETLERVKADIAEALDLGIYITPMIFINGVEVKGWRSTVELGQIIDRLSAAAPPPMGPENDRPPLATAKIISDWRDQAPRQIPEDKQAWPLGPSDAKVRIVLFGDYAEEVTTLADRVICELVRKRGDVRYHFRPFPFDSDCNPAMKDKRFPMSCRAAAAAEAAGVVGGADAFWKMHDWLMNNRNQYDDARLLRALGDLGLDPAAIRAALDAPDTKAAIELDGATGQRIGLKSIPMIFINEKFVSRWRVPKTNESLLAQMLDEAAKMP
ncbi:DSBA-like thioredoxin domain protein [Phycisphaerae bacterium RAS1]|nr:DSBA-like thioredoxin domain protein [Phycisphaerae bacterium RAS1]